MLALLLFTGLPLLFDGQFNSYTRYTFLTQDAWLAPFFAAACLIRSRPVTRERLLRQRLEQRLVLLCLIFMLLVCWAGRFLVFGDFDSTPDEQMVAFDAAIFRDGSLVWPIAPEWRPLANALNRDFMLTIGSAEAWISSYLPINAALHAIVGRLIDEDLTAPLLVAAGGYCLWRISLRLWPQSVGARVAAFAFYVGSSQILVTGMTKFAMTAHLTLSLCWLLLFLRGGRSSHAAAIFVGFLATGLHQPLFHPLFVLPFLALLASERRWKLLASYLFAYACIGLFWLSWPLMMSSLGSGPEFPASTAQTVSHFDRLMAILNVPDFNSAWLMGANLVRFITWQHLLLFPLASFGVWGGWRSDPLVRALAVSFALPILLSWFLLPWQGAGWGYRYLHPVLGNAILLGGWGWNLLERNHGRDLWRPLFWTTAASVLLLLPLHGWMAHRLVRPIAELDSKISALDADAVILDAHFFEVFAHNRHDFSNRPVRLIGPELQPHQIAEVCRNRSVAFVDPPRPFRPSDRQRVLKHSASQVDCAVTTVRLSMAEHLLRADRLR